ncbi:MAG: glycosyltransferase family 2 protein [bacterium]|nr:glycosyltransferase family 2 protein [bacterium]
MVTGIVLTHNSESTLARTLTSLSFCDEIIVVDDYSVDKTRDIAQSFNARVFRRHLESDFSAQRNFALAKAKGGEWVLFVDSDEVVSSELASEIKKATGRQTQDVRRKTQDAGMSGYFLKRKDFFGGKWLAHGETADVRLLRLARVHAGVWKRPIHETWEINEPVGVLHAPLLHYSHEDIAQFIERIDSYSTLNARFFYKQGKRAGFISIFAYPAAKFFLNYVLRFGFLDGTAGAVMAIIMSFHSFLTRGKLYFLWQYGL